MSTGFRIPILDCELCKCQPDQHMNQHLKHIWLECPSCHAKSKPYPVTEDFYKSWLKPIVSWNDLQSNTKEQKRKEVNAEQFFIDRRINLKSKNCMLR